MRSEAWRAQERVGHSGMRFPGSARSCELREASDHLALLQVGLPIQVGCLVLGTA